MRKLIAFIAASTCAVLAPTAAQAQLGSLSLLGNGVQLNAGTEQHTNAGLLGVHVLGSDHLLALQAPNLGPNGQPLDLRLATPYDEDLEALLDW